MTQIQPYSLWIGHAGEARDYERIADAGIEALVNLAAEKKCDQPPRELLYLRFPLIDGIGNRTGWLAWLLGRGESRARQEGKMKGARGPYPRWSIGT